MTRVFRKIRRNYHQAMIIPAIVLFSVFFLYPLARGIGISLTNWKGYGEAKYVGLSNFIHFFSDKRAKSDMFNTLHFGLVTPLLMNVLGLAYALLLDEKLKGRGIARVIVYLPAIISPLIIGYIWLIVLRRDGGALHDIMNAFGLGAYFKQWLSSPKEAMRVVILINVWQKTGSVMIIYLAGMQSIPQELYEVAHIDGANGRQRFTYITLPLLIPSIKINVITNMIGCLCAMDSIVALTDGGPGYSTETLSLFIYRMTYGSNTGYATAVALILFFLILVPTFFSYRMLGKRDVEL